MSVTVVSCVYGEHYRQFVPRWAKAVEDLDPQPDAVIVATDGHVDVPGARVIESFCHWRYPQAWHLQQAIAAATTDWVWILDIDDLAFPDALQGLHDVMADVWQLGNERSDGEKYTPPRMTAAEFLASERNVYVAGSMIRTDIFREVGGFRDVALQDWCLWRTLARHGASVEPSQRMHFQYMRHPKTRGATELTLDVRADHYAEMLEAELAVA
jgi:hypothetical protein